MSSPGYGLGAALREPCGAPRSGKTWGEWCCQQEAHSRPCAGPGHHQAQVCGTRGVLWQEDAPPAAGKASGPGYAPQRAPRPEIPAPAAMTGCAAAAGRAPRGQREGWGPAPGIDSRFAQSGQRLLVLHPPFPVPAASLPAPRRLAGRLSRKCGCSLPAVARRRDPRWLPGGGVYFRERGGVTGVRGGGGWGGGSTMSTMFADTLLIVFISVCTALLAEGECRAAAGRVAALHPRAPPAPPLPAPTQPSGPVGPVPAGLWRSEEVLGPVLTRWCRPREARGRPGAARGWPGEGWWEAAPRLCRAAPERWQAAG